jgi:hypothetical protein
VPTDYTITVQGHRIGQKAGLGAGVASPSFLIVLFTVISCQRGLSIWFDLILFVWGNGSAEGVLFRCSCVHMSFACTMFPFSQERRRRAKKKAQAKDAKLQAEKADKRTLAQIFDERIGVCVLALPCWAGLSSTNCLLLECGCISCLHNKVCLWVKNSHI